jgi:hypothetical protein
MQRRTLREAGSDRNEAKVRDEKTAEDSLQWRCSRFTECRGEAERGGLNRYRSRSCGTLKAAAGAKLARQPGVWPLREVKVRE